MFQFGGGLRALFGGAKPQKPPLVATGQA